jgi:hypothetical protein
MHDVNARIVKQLQKVRIRLDFAEAAFLGENERVGHAQQIRIANANEPRTLEREMIAAFGNAAAADDGTRKLIGRSGRAPKHARGNNVECSEGRAGLQQISSCANHFHVLLPILVTPKSQDGGLTADLQYYITYAAIRKSPQKKNQNPDQIRIPAFPTASKRFAAVTAGDASSFP